MSTKDFDAFDYAARLHSPLKDVCVVMVHPFFASIYHSHLIPKDSLKQDQYNSYCNHLDAIKKNPTISVILAEEAYTLALTDPNELLNEEFDRIIITEDGSGDLTDLLPIPCRELKEKEVYFCGGYLGRCLRDTAIDLRNRTNFKIPKRFIQEASIYHPKSYSLQKAYDERDEPRGIEEFVSITDVLALANASQDRPQTSNYQ